MKNPWRSFYSVAAQKTLGTLMLAGQTWLLTPSRLSSIVAQEHCETQVSGLGTHKFVLPQEGLYYPKFPISAAIWRIEAEPGGPRQRDFVRQICDL